MKKNQSPVKALTYRDMLTRQREKLSMQKHRRTMNAHWSYFNQDAVNSLLNELNLWDEIRKNPPLSYWIYEDGHNAYWIGSDAKRKIVIKVSDQEHDHEFMESIYNGLYTFRGYVKKSK